MRQVSTKLLINDKVEIIAGKDKGRVGKILRLDKAKGKITVERINLVKKHQKAKDASQSGQIIEKEGAIDISNVMIICPECAEAVRIGSKILGDGAKVRICKKCKATLLPQKK